MTHGALFNGIGGFQLAAQWMGWENVFHCEIDKFCNRVVKKHFPKSICYEDIKQTDFMAWRGTIDVLTGGFPCQPYSAAGARKGTADDRHLWPQMLRTIGEISPRWVVGENVRGLTNWSGGLVFDQVQADLETAGYEVLPFLLPACGINAPHRRERIWFIAHRYPTKRECQISRFRPQSIRGSIELAADPGGAAREQGIKFEGGEQDQKRDSIWSESGSTGKSGFTADSEGIQKRKQTDKIIPISASWETWPEHGGAGGQWYDFPTQSPICGRDDGIPDRVDRLRSLGNAIVPQVALEIFKAIQSYEQVIRPQKHP